VAQAVYAARPRKRLPPNELRVRTIAIDTKDIFDPSIPAESAWPYRFVNVLHIRTRDEVIRRELLVKPSRLASDLALDESERSLRALPFIKSAQIERVRVNDRETDLIVHVQDSWTTQPQINFGSEGGQTKYEIGFVEENILGFGKRVSYFYRDNPDEIEQEFTYADPQLFGSRLKLETSIRSFTTGNAQSLSLNRPFYSIRTHRSGGFAASRNLHLEKRFDNATEISRYESQNHSVSAVYGHRLNHDPYIAHRLTGRYFYTEDLFKAEAGTRPGTLPKSIAFAGPQIQWTREPEDFIKESFIDKAGRVEDINIGHRVLAASGYSADVLGASANTVPLLLQHGFGLGRTEKGFALFEYGLAGRYQVDTDAPTPHQLAHTLYFASMNFYRQGKGKWPLTHVWHAESAYIQNPDSANLLEVGGNTGLRGFKNQSFTGNKTLLMNWESRLFYPEEILRLIYLGGAVFADMGQAQTQGQAFRRQDFHANVGVGFRFGLSRSSSGNIYRLDVAYALGKVPGGNRVIVSISSGTGFSRTQNTTGRFSPKASF